MTTFTLTSAEDTVATAKAYEQIKAVEDAVAASGQNAKPFEIRDFSGTYTSAVHVASRPPVRAKRTGRS
jgi:hypothetical protein